MVRYLFYYILDIRLISFITKSLFLLNVGLCFAGSSSILLLSPKRPIILRSLKSKEEAVMVVDVPSL